MRLVRPLVALVTLGYPSLIAAQPPTPPIEHVTMQSALTEALQKNLELIARRAGISIADANLVTARLRPNPVFTAGGDHLDLLGTGFSRINTAGPPEYSARVDVLVERGGKRAARTLVAEDERAIADADVRDTMRTLTLDVRQAFIDAQLAQETCHWRARTPRRSTKLSR